MAEFAVPHPRETLTLIGHAAAEQRLALAASSGQLAHAWLITGPKGVGKATLAHRFARFLVAGGAEERDLIGEAPQNLGIDPELPAARQAIAGSHPDIVTLEPGRDERTGRERSEILVDDIRRLGRFLAMTASEGGWRIAIIDSADTLNRNAANAALKFLEEPPPRTVLLLVAHAPGRLLPTIVSRCVRIRLSAVATNDVARLLRGSLPDLDEADAAALTELADGSPGRALEFAAEGGLALYREMAGILEGLPALDTAAVHKLGDRLARRGNEAEFRRFVQLLPDWFARTVREIVDASRESGGDRQRIMRWLEARDTARELLLAADAANLDKKAVTVETFGHIARTIAA